MARKTCSSSNVSNPSISCGSAMQDALATLARFGDPVADQHSHDKCGWSKPIASKPIALSPLYLDGHLLHKGSQDKVQHLLGTLE